MILCSYESEPTWPVDEGRARYVVTVGEASRWVETDGTAPTLDEVKAHLGIDQPPTPDEVVIERKRRLALGFDYDFGDARGVHHIGTTDADQVGWRDVTDYTNALMDLGDTTTRISIVTDTGPAEVTAPEWQAVILEAARWRQRLWAASFVLQAMDPIPTDYADDSRWA